MAIMAATMNSTMAVSIPVVQPSGLLSCEKSMRRSSLGGFPLQSKSLRLLCREYRNQHVVKQGRRGRVTTMATTVAFADVDSEPSSGKEEEVSTSELLCCPICYDPLIRKGPTGLNQAAVKRSGFSCGRCKRSYSNRDVFLDLTVLAGSEIYEEPGTPGTETFRSPVVSFVYERGWRQSFGRAGFPGPDEEFKMAQDYFKPTVGGVMLDVSCGSGLFTRRLARSGDYKAVIALDFSENMLRQTGEFIKQDAALSNSDIALVRADVARLPFATGSIDAVHAGAALHCWPSPAAGVAEISRILKPGGVFVATTFLTSIPLFDFGNQDLRKALKRTIRTSTIRYWDEEELEELCGTCGLVDYTRIRRNNFIMLSARKSE